MRCNVGIDYLQWRGPTQRGDQPRSAASLATPDPARQTETRTGAAGRKLSPPSICALTPRIAPGPRPASGGVESSRTPRTSRQRLECARLAAAFDRLPGMPGGLQLSPVGRPEPRASVWSARGLPPLSTGRMFPCPTSPMESIAPNFSGLEPAPTGNLTPEPPANDWPHPPVRRLSENRVCLVSAGTLHLQFQNECGGGAG
jgi:hypothetical protein